MKSKANVMILKTEKQGENRLDWLKWLVTFCLLLAGLTGNYYYSQVSVWWRMLAWLALLAVVCLIASRTQKGQWITEFVRESRVELRKVFWPTREEVVQTTLVVTAMVIILALILWGVDGILVWLIGWLTGQRG